MLETYVLFFYRFFCVNLKIAYMRDNSGGWFKHRTGITSKKVSGHLLGSVVTGYVFLPSVDIFCFDIDIHEKGLTAKERRLKQKERYEWLVYTIGYAPSFVCLYSDGIHLTVG